MANKTTVSKKKRVLFISYNGLLEPILFSQAVPYMREIAKYGYEFTLLTYEKRKDLDRVKRDDRRKIWEDLKSSGIEWRWLRYHKYPRFVSTFFDLFVGLLYCAYLIPAKHIRIVHVRGATPGSIMLFLSKLYRVKILFDMRGRLAEEMAAGGLWEEGGRIYNLVRRSEEALLGAADAVTVLTHKHLEYNRSLGYHAGGTVPTDVIPCCVDMNRFCRHKTRSDELRKDLGLENKFILAYSGKTGTFYFTDQMLEFYKCLHDTIPESTFLILTTDAAGPLLEKASSLGIKDENIKVVVNPDFNSIPSYLSMADAAVFFINPSNKLGSSPIKFGEFLSCEVPVIINPGVGDTEEIVLDNKVGVIVRDFDDNAYGAAVKELSKLKMEGKALSARCRDTARKYLSLEDGAAKYLAIYDKLTER